jgi:hypothetical protein
VYANNRISHYPFVTILTCTIWTRIGYLKVKRPNSRTNEVPGLTKRTSSIEVQGVVRNIDIYLLIVKQTLTFNLLTLYSMAPRKTVIVYIGVFLCSISVLIAIEQHATLYTEDNARASNGTLPYSTTARSTIVCVSKCLEDECCESVNYHNQSKACELTTVKYPAKPSQLENVEGWKWMYKEPIKGK